MPVIVIGADTATGQRVVERLMPQAIEVRSFVSDPEVGMTLRRLGAKVATGDVSDGSHIEAASMRCFCAVVIAEAAVDERERSFADTPQAVADMWRAALRGAGVTRVIWVDDVTHPIDPDSLSGVAPEHVVLQPSPDLAERVAELENAESITT